MNFKCFGLLEKLFLFILIGVGMTSTSQGADWPMFMGSQNHQGDSNTESVPTNLLWNFKTLGSISSSPAVVNDTVFFGSDDGNMYAINKSDGKLKWLFATQGAVKSSPTVANGIIYFLSMDGKFYALEQSSGKLVWRYETQGEKTFSTFGLYTSNERNRMLSDPFDFYLSSAVVSGDLVYFGSSDHRLYALNKNTGKLQWSFNTGGVIHSSPAIANGMLFVGSYDGAVYALDAETGKEKWRLQGETEQVQNTWLGITASPTIYEDTLYIGSKDAYIYAINIADGTLKWKYEAGRSWVLSTLAVDKQSVYFGTSDSALFIALDRHSGEEKYKVNTNFWTYSSPIVAGDEVMIGNMIGEWFRFNKHTGERLSSFSTPARKNDEFLLFEGNSSRPNGKKLFNGTFADTMHSGMSLLKRLGAFIGTPALVDDQLYVPSSDGNLYVFGG